jgi:inosine-uridine nucleoside N-ribohydrolase
MLKQWSALFLGMVLWVAPAAAQEKVILDSDYTTIGDDGQVGVMAMQLHAQGVINLLGITVVAGNQWLPQEVSDALKAVERMGLVERVGCTRAHAIHLSTTTRR